ncbi:MAG: nuclease, partial [Microcystis sp.]
MLDLAKLAAKMPGISQHFQQEVAASRERVQRAKILLEQAQQQQEKLLELYHN